MADPNLIACLYPFGSSHVGYENALRSVHMNETRRVEPLFEDRSREASQALDEFDNDDDNDNDNNNDNDNDNDNGRAAGPSYLYSPGLRLLFDDERKNRIGFVFGTGSNSDIVLPRRNTLAGLASSQCAITFDDHGRLILRDLQDPRRRRGATAVTYGGKGGQKRRNFTWILSGERFTLQNEPIVIAFHDNLKFQIVVTRHDLHSRTYQENVAWFPNRVDINVDELSLGRFGFQSTGSTATPSGAQTPSIQDPILLDNGELGRGAQAVVTRVWDVSTGVEYAAKDPLTDRYHDRLRREVQLLRQINHDCIVQCIFQLSRETSVPRLVLECVPLGSLEDQHKERAISIEETFELLRQGLSALRHLHEREDPIVHRDIKPSNILVQSRTPHLHIKLSDFGFSRENQDYLKTNCGTPLYAAPEIFNRKLYDAAVDVWSLGVVVMQYAYRLPEIGRHRAFNGVRWTDDIVQALETGVEDLYCPLLTFLQRAMLVKDRESRYSAHRCSTQMRHLDVSRFRCSNAELAAIVRPYGHRTVAAQGNQSEDAASRDKRSGAPSPRSFPSASAVRQTTVSQISDSGPPPAAGEVAYFFDQFSNPLHPLFVGSSLGEAEEPASDGATPTDASIPRSLSRVEPVAPTGGPNGPEPSVVLDSGWYHDPSLAVPPQDGCR